MGAHVKSAGPQLTFPVHFSRCFPSLFKIRMREHQSTNKLSIKANNWEGNKPPISAEQIRSEISLNMVNTSIRPVSHAGAASRDMSSRSPYGVIGSQTVCWNPAGNAILLSSKEDSTRQLH